MERGKSPHPPLATPTTGARKFMTSGREVGRSVIEGGGGGQTHLGSPRSSEF